MNWGTPLSANRMAVNQHPWEKSRLIFLIIVAFLTTGAFFRQAKLAGTHPGKAASFPLIAFGVLMVFTHLASSVIAHILIATDASIPTVKWIDFLLNCFVILIYFKLIKTSWDQLVKRAADKVNAASTIAEPREHNE